MWCSQCQIVCDSFLKLLMFFSFRLVVEITQTKDVMGRFFQQSSFSNPVHRTGGSLLTTKFMLFPKPPF